LSPNTHIKLGADLHAKFHRFSLLPPCLLIFIYYLLHRPSFHAIMTGETNQTSPVVDNVVASGSKVVTDGRATLHLHLPHPMLPHSR
jgi:hypothetical protein